jgi:hypothetical protein
MQQKGAHGKGKIVPHVIPFFEHFLAEYESRFEKEYGFFRPILKEVVE